MESIFIHFIILYSYNLLLLTFIIGYLIYVNKQIIQLKQKVKNELSYQLDERIYDIAYDTVNEVYSSRD